MLKFSVAMIPPNHPFLPTGFFTCPVEHTDLFRFIKHYFALTESRMFQEIPKLYDNLPDKSLFFVDSLLPAGLRFTAIII